MGLSQQLKETEPFNHLPAELFEDLQQAAELRSYAPNTYVFHQNEPPTGYLYVIREGLVEITLMNPGGVEMVVDYRQEGQFFGATPIFSEDPYSAGARTVRKTECYLIPAERIRRLAREYPQVSAYFTRIVLSRVRNLYAEIVSDHSQKALTQMEAYPFKKRLSEIMSSPPVTCRPEDSAREVARRLTEAGISAILVLSEQGRLQGIITERDLVSKVLAPRDSDPDSLTARAVMTPQVQGLSPDTYMFEAMAYMTANRLRHLPVLDRDEVVGIVTLRDLMRFRSQKAMLLVGNARQARDFVALAAVRREIATVARTLLSETRATPDVMEILSYIHHTIIRRTFDLCLEQMRAEGIPQPEIRYCFLIMGSGGRREMLLHPDQDNGFVFEDFPDERLPEVEAFFLPLADKLVKALDEVGYPLCSGQVMVDNPLWRGRLRDWRARIHDWVNEPEPQKVRYSSIFFDFVPMAGDGTLAQDLREIVHQQIRSFQGFLYHMMSLDLRYRVPVGLLGRFLTEKSGPHKGELSLKHGGTVYIVDCVRMFALERELTEITTLERLDALVKRNVFSAETAEHIRAAFEALSFLRLRNELILLDQGLPPSHHLNPHSLSKTEQDLLRESFNAVSKLQDATKRHFARTPF
ncbi:putative nucleotidyltransferase substrate binding domain-containing protein [Geoalkalibacter sp.]|uniref:putative nucleotidyltransferase substrate binding domain-containing protein n=1 Tax=Geoalkalibacter sp. TaxID=3041440 RepID=UPI00272E62F9|nr:putative nucleotidyltransferase substrate binding domain-containing protein [Geoalkalibacter sp.]